MSDIKCPQCGAQQTQDFGIMNCPSCGAVLMADMEGQVQLMNTPAESSETEGAESVISSSDDNPDSFQDIQDFANSDAPISPLLYTLTISGIDRGDLRRDLLEIFSDEKFKLNPRDTIGLIKGGKLELVGLNAAKASVLLIRLRRLPLQISWRQHAY